MTDVDHIIAFQGAKGANSDLACHAVFPEMESLPCYSFEDTFAAVHEGKARLAMIPIENSSAGRVADNHHLMPESGLHIIGEHYEKIEHRLLAPKGASLAGLKQVHSHVHALAQCRKFLRAHNIEPIVAADTAGAAQQIAKLNDPSVGAIATSLAGKIYGLDTLSSEISDAEDNTTRFLIMSKDPIDPDPAKTKVMMTFVFRVRSVPAALYKALGGFATNGVNITKLESYITDGSFSVAQFYADIEGHPNERLVRLALEELSFFSKEVKILGVYPANSFRERGVAAE
ncbi:prephenate dehydratase [Kiloniella laminariae]|uniref:prephenate dehydratase n=1 Tax=Kiloniella laminariae TaxID=454162 RepID=UPI00035CFE04|nr:prephenate dehydratase [Kiloniella laminariae]